jgi:hypothetical protein
LGARVPRPGQQYIPKETDEEEAFISEIQEALLCAARHHQHSALNAFNDLGKAVAAAWTKNAKTSKAGSNPTPWWTPECELAKLAYEGEKNSINLKIYLSTTKHARKAFFNNKIQTMTSTKCPWEGMRWVGPRAPPAFPSISDSAGDPIKDPEKLFAHMHRHFSSTAASGTVDWSLLNTLPQHNTRPCLPISMAEILEALGKMSNASAPGNDHVTWRHFKLIINDDEPLKAVTHLFNLVLKEGIWPSQFKDAKSAIIPKPKKPAYDIPKAFCPIALLNTLGKLLTKVLARRMQFDGQAHGLFHEGQFGGISKHATTDVGLILVDMITENRDRSLHASVLALDIAQFFPSIHHGVLHIMLTKLSFHKDLVRVISSLLEDCSTTYRWDGISSDTHFQCSNGVPQGDPLSPVLSALYLLLIIKHLFPWGYEHWVNSLFFVDDGTIIVSSFSLDDNVSFLSLFYKHFLCLLAGIGLMVEQSKLELKHFIAFNPTGPRRSFVLANQPNLVYTWKGVEYIVKPQEVWRYLGFFFNSFLKFDFHV